MKHVMPALAVVRQLDLDTEERIGILEFVEAIHCCCAFPYWGSGSDVGGELQPHNHERLVPIGQPLYFKK
jgi:hypothetical protein